MKLAERLSIIQPSPTLAITSLAKKMQREGRDVVGFGAGEPDFDTPNHIKDAAIRALQEGKTKYAPVPGIVELREAISQKFAKENGLHFSPEEILVSVGGKHALYNFFQAFINPGDEVIIIKPYWVSYADIALLAGAKPVYIDTKFENGFKIKPEDLESAITSKTKLLVMNSPSNPAGVYYQKQELQELAQVILKYPQVAILTDDIYEKILYDAEFCNFPMADPSLLDRTIIINGLSKAYSMTGWRLGYTASKIPGLIAAMSKLQGQSTSGATTFAQYGAVAALTGDQSCVAEMVSAFRKRRDYIVQAINEIPGLKVNQPDGAFYVFPDMSEFAQNDKFQKEWKESGKASADMYFAEKLLEQKEVALVPGSAFGVENAFRISYATSSDQIEKGIKRIHEFVKTYL
ncbi:MAG: pyridoxal phosphate-dependent aminotransferase [Candidatus Hydrogenedentota bacterium]|nr:MAG: pyridoxal phosphate-dependent aminotransferase [Candidatus Hydrogenedentota bacterium]